MQPYSRHFLGPGEGPFSLGPGAKGLAELATAVMPEQMTLILAATVPLTLQLSLPIGTILPLSTPPPPPAMNMTHEGRRDIMMFCKSQILPDPKAKGFLKHKKNPQLMFWHLPYTLYWKENTLKKELQDLILP